MYFIPFYVFAFYGASPVSARFDVDLTSTDSIKTAASIIASNLLSYYNGNQPGQIPGILPGPPPTGPYYWWEGGALWGTMVDYWHYTGDTRYNNDTQDSLVFQAGSPQNSYMPPNWTASLGNDDQGFWGMSAMLAAETNFENPAAKDPQWLALAQAVFNTQVARWDTEYCNGGLRWQIPLSNNGYDYKNSIANAILFNLGARLARYTANDTYAQWAVKVWDWTKAVGYIDDDYNIYDGAHVEHSCTDINKAQFSYTAAIFLQGAGFMYNHTNGSTIWTARVANMTNRTLEYFFPDGIAIEPPCEHEFSIGCTTDMLSFKGYLHRFLAQTTQMAPFIRQSILPVLRTSAAGAMSSCNADGTCGFRWNKWNNGSYDGNTGAGQQMNALGALLGLLVEMKAGAAPLTNSTGGTSPGNPNAGSDPDLITSGFDTEIAEKDRAGAAVLTTVVLVAFISMLFWMGCQGNDGPTRVDPKLMGNKNVPRTVPV